jgi:glycerate kinase
MRIVVAPDKFKGSLPAAEVAAAVAAGLRAVAGDAEILAMPVADGGDGTVDAAVAAGFERVPVTAAGPDGEPVRASYARRGDVAVVELACVCGLALLPAGRRAPLTASSFGAGEVLRAARTASPSAGRWRAAEWRAERTWNWWPRSTWPDCIRRSGRERRRLRSRPTWTTR